MRVSVNPELLRWACERAGLNIQIIARRLPKLPSWEKGEGKPTLKQLERFAKIVHAPIGYLFLPAPLSEKLPIPDFRTSGNIRIDHPSPDLLETIYLCQQRQEWYRDFSQAVREDPCDFVGSASLSDEPVNVAEKIRSTLGFAIESRRKMSTWEEALRQFIAQADAAGIMIMVSGVVGSNTRRKLDHEEFRGFALSDKRAPLVFVNGADTKSAQMFTLAHELAHIWLGKTGVSDIAPVSVPSNEIEKWCNNVAAEILAPMALFKKEFDNSNDMLDEFNRLARFFKVSTLVIIRRLFDSAIITRDEYKSLYMDELGRLLEITKGKGGNYYLTQPTRVSKRFARALIISTLEGQTLHRDALQLLGLKKTSTFHELGARLGVA
ncbi:MAG: ImmA/IrrE family metallo-endopeptidase [Chitinispirillaceae bacterium]|nr:ImmA/IrrE family metallo-endopeptidase [Chitinispirillaceae bacterium]